MAILRRCENKRHTSHAHDNSYCFRCMLAHVACSCLLCLCVALKTKINFESRTALAKHERARTSESSSLSRVARAQDTPPQHTAAPHTHLPGLGRCKYTPPNNQTTHTGAHKHLGIRMRMYDMCSGTCETRMCAYISVLHACNTDTHTHSLANNPK